MAINVWFCPNENCINHEGAVQPDLQQMMEILESYDAPFTGAQCYCGEWMDADTCLQEKPDDWKRTDPEIVDDLGADAQLDLSPEA